MLIDVDWLSHACLQWLLAIAVVPCTVLRMRLMFDAMLSYIVILNVFYSPTLCDTHCFHGVDLFFCGPPSYPITCDGALPPPGIRDKTDLDGVSRCLF